MRACTEKSQAFINIDGQIPQKDNAAVRTARKMMQEVRGIASRFVRRKYRGRLWK